MTKSEAHAILDKLREGHIMPLSLTTQALYATGDIYLLPSESLRFDGDEPCNDRPCEIQSQGTEVGFSYSKYLDCPTNDGVTQ